MSFWTWNPTVGQIRTYPYLTSEILAEILRVLAYPRFQLTETEIQYLLYVEILPFCSVVAAKSGSTIIKEDPSDDMFLKCCGAANAKALISGDNHLLNLKSYRNTQIFTPSQFLKQFHEELHI